MSECLLEAQEKLKRLEHILYVSLKYTRTADVLINALHRLIDIFDDIIMALLEKAEEDKLVDVIPKSPALAGRKLAELFPDDEELQKYLSFYLFLRNILKLPYTKRQEYRRHVTLIVKLDHSTAEIDSDNLLNCEKFIYKFFHYAEEKIYGKKKEE